jgi:hypothetical protein
MVILCLKLQRIEEALIYIEGGKSKTFVDLLAFTKLKQASRSANIKDSFLREEAECIQVLRAIQIRHLRGMEKRADLSKVENTIEKLNYIYEMIKKKYPEYVSLRKGEPIGYKEIQKLLRAPLNE